MTINQKEFVIKIKESHRAKNLRLQYSKLTGCTLVLPHTKSLQSGLDFLEKVKSWLAKKMLAHYQDVTKPNSIYFQPLDEVSVFGTPFQLIHHPTVAQLKRIMIEDFTIHIHCQINDLHALVVKWLYAQSNHYFQQRSLHYAKLLNVSSKKITVKEMTSRWGSCSARGNLSYSWRLSLADPQIADYLCAHEVCHLKEMNHSTKFWALVQQIYPNYKVVRRRLKKDGWQLFSYYHG